MVRLRRAGKENQAVESNRAGVASRQVRWDLQSDVAGRKNCGSQRGDTEVAALPHMYKLNGSWTGGVGVNGSKQS